MVDTHYYENFQGVAPSGAGRPAPSRAAAQSLPAQTVSEPPRACTRSCTWSTAHVPAGPPGGTGRMASTAEVDELPSSFADYTPEQEAIDFDALQSILDEVRLAQAPPRAS